MTVCDKFQIQNHSQIPRHIIIVHCYYSCKMSFSCKFSSQKISKIRWRPQSSDILQASNVFAVGSWDDVVNKISIWLYPVSIENGKSEYDPIHQFERNHIGGVTDLKYLNHDLLMAGSSNGNVSLYRHKHDTDLCHQHTWQHPHHFLVNDAACTAVDSYDNNIVSVGEDGRIIIYAVKQLQPLRTIIADKCIITGVVFSNQNEIITSSTSGELKVWDLRNPSNQPVNLLSQSGVPEALLCVTSHPTLPSLLACGTDHGTVCMWDLKQDRYPLAPLSAHQGPITDLKFHPKSPNHLFTCSMDGKVLHWNSTPLAHLQMSANIRTNVMGEALTISPNPWLSCDASKHHLDISSLIPSRQKSVNCLDIVDETLLSGSDDEIIYVVSQLKLL